MSIRLQLELAWNRVVLDGVSIELTATECRVVAYLDASGDRCVPGGELLSEVWGRSAGKPRVVKSTIHRLRQKLEADPAHPQILKTVPGKGYQLVRPTEPTRLQPPGRPAGIWVDRPGLRKTLEAALADGRIALLVGPGGAGKTRLASELLGAAADDYPGNTARIDAPAEAGIGRIATAIADQLQIAIDTDGTAQIGRALAARGPCLLLIDNLDTAPAEVFEALEQWTAAAPGLRLLLTARHWHPLEGAIRVEVPPLGLDEAVDLFIARSLEAGEPRPSRAEAEAVVSALDRLPLAIELAAACSDVLTPSELSRRMGAPTDALHTALRTSWSLLSASTQQALAQIVVFQDGFTADTAERVVELQGSTALAELRTLRHHSLLQRSAGRFHMLPALREGVRALAPDSSGAAERLIRWAALAAQHHADRMRTAHLDHALRWLRIERSTLLDAYDRAVLIDLSAAGRIAIALCSAADAWGSMDHLDILRSALELELPDSDRAWLLRFDAKIHAASGRAEAATERFEQARELADPGLRTQLKYDFGELWVVLGAFDKAEAELTPLVEVDPLDLRASALRRLGEMARHTLRNEAASSYFSAALEAAEGSGNLPVLIATLCSFGEYLHAQGKRAPAYRHLRRAIATAQEHHLDLAVSRARSLLGHASHEDGNSSEARELLLGACASLRRSGHSRQLMHVLLRIGWVEAALGDTAQAREHLREGRALARVSATPILPFFEMNLAVCELDEGRAQAALDRLDRAVAAAEQAASKLNLATLLFHRGWALAALDRRVEAQADLDRAMPLCIQAYPGIAGTCCALSACLTPTNREALHQASTLLRNEDPALGAIRLLQVRVNRPSAVLTRRVRTDAESTAFGRQVLRWLEAAAGPGSR